MLNSILIFIIFLGPLVFFHELGHFLFARFFGVRVETFSIGFGPKILSFKRGDTQYAISLIPLGGYVKMYGDNIMEKDNVPETQREYAYTHKSLWARFWIVFGGPLANFIMAFALFYFLLIAGEKAPQAQVGYITQTSTLSEVGFRSGDKILKVNNTQVETVNELTSLQDGSNSITLKRGDKEVEVTTELKREELMSEIASSMAYLLRQPIVVDEKGQFYTLSTKSNDVNWNISYEDFRNYEGILWLTPVSKGASKDEESNIFLDQDIMFNKGRRLEIQSNFDEVMRENDLYPADLSVKSIVMGSPADKAGVKAGDIIVQVGSTEISSFIEMRDKIQDLGSTGDIEIKLIRDAKEVDLKLNAEKDEGSNYYKVGVYRRDDFILPQMLTTKPKGLLESVPLALGRTWKGMKEVVLTFKKLITSEASMKNLGGPIAIAKYASASFYTGITQFLAFMAMMSINLGIINLFPIPVLDGGHIMFMGIELINRGPLSPKKMQIAYQVGFSLLIMILAVALINDFSNLF